MSEKIYENEKLTFPQKQDYSDKIGSRRNGSTRTQLIVNSVEEYQQLFLWMKNSFKLHNEITELHYFFVSTHNGICTHTSLEFIVLFFDNNKAVTVVSIKVYTLVMPQTHATCKKLSMPILDYHHW